MLSITKIVCPNCGSPAAERLHIADRQLNRTQCRECDYLMVTCLRTNRVLEAYAPSLDRRKVRAILDRQAAS
jgi:transposase-like protein